MVDIKASYKNVPVISYDKYDQAYSSMQEHNQKSWTRCRRRSCCIRWQDETIRKLTGEVPDAQSIQDVTGTVMEESRVEEILLNMQEPVPLNACQQRDMR